MADPTPFESAMADAAVEAGGDAGDVYEALLDPAADRRRVQDWTGEFPAVREVHASDLIIMRGAHYLAQRRALREAGAESSTQTAAGAAAPEAAIDTTAVELAPFEVPALPPAAAEQNLQPDAPNVPRHELRRPDGPAVAAWLGDDPSPLSEQSIEGPLEWWRNDVLVKRRGDDDEAWEAVE